MKMVNAPRSCAASETPGITRPLFFWGGGVEKDKGQLGSRFILGDYTTESYPSYDFNQLFAFQAIFRCKLAGLFLILEKRTIGCKGDIPRIVCSS